MCPQPHPSPREDETEEHESQLALRRFVTSLIAGINQEDDSDNLRHAGSLHQGTVREQNANTKAIFLTLHVLFPNELLAALDLLDRGLLTRLVVNQNEPIPSTTHEWRDPERRPCYGAVRPSASSVSIPARNLPKSQPVGVSESFGLQRSREVQPFLDAVALQGQDGVSRQHRRGISFDESDRSDPRIRRGATRTCEEDEARNREHDPQCDQENAHSRRVQESGIEVRPSRHSIDNQQADPSPVRPTSFSTDGGNNGVGFYYVRSAQQTRHRSHHHHRSSSTPVTSYEVHLNAWSCSCPAFIFSAFPARPSSSSTTTTTTTSTAAAADKGPSNDELTNGSEVTHCFSESPASPGWIFGGLSNGSHLPVCKHLLACVLAEHVPSFGEAVEHREVGVEELAGWAAGWADGW